MARTVAIGIQDFETIITNDCFYIDKTHFIKEWWENRDSVTLITRPRRFGKTLNMSMLECFFSLEYADKGNLFENLAIWKEEKYRNLQGTYPVISLSFANVKADTFEKTKIRICQILTDLYIKYDFLKDSGVLTEKDREYFDRVSEDMPETDATISLHRLCDYVKRYYGKKPIMLLDEYDTPMQEAYVYGYWEEIVSFTRTLFNAAFKTNPCLERAVMTGITRVSKESVFSDLNNLKAVTTTSGEYAEAFGFTEEEVFAGMDEQGLTQKEEVKKWYDGFTFGNKRDIYNPWSILNYLDTGKFGTYWANTSSNSLVGKLLRESSPEIKENFHELLMGKSLKVSIDEQIIYNQLDDDENSIWSLLLAGGYLKVLSLHDDALKSEWGDVQYELALTNIEVRNMFASMIRGWFKGKSRREYNGFIHALLNGDTNLMNLYMEKVVLSSISYFDTGNRPSVSEPERFYHGLVLGLLVELYDKYVITSNRESGYGRYDVLMEPKEKEEPAIILEFKVRNPKEEQSLEETADAALRQIEEKRYAQALAERGFSHEDICKYGFAFEGKNVLIKRQKI